MPGEKAAWGQLLNENGSKIGVVVFSWRHKGEAGSDRALRLLTLAPVPVTPANTTAGAMYSFDISFVDEWTQTYYLADRSNKVVDVVDAKTGTFTKQISVTPPFKGFTPCPSPAGANDCSGPD